VAMKITNQDIEKMLGEMGEQIRKEFADLDYNNQRNFLWCCVDMARAREEGREYDMRNFSYNPKKYQKLLIFAEALSLESSGELTRAAMRLTQLNKKSRVEELLSAL